MLNETKSCANCKHLSPPASVRFANGKTEERMVCMRGHWKSSSLVFTIHNCAGNYRRKAEKCKEWQSA
jgi:hypothetical protein